VVAAMHASAKLANNLLKKKDDNKPRLARIAKDLRAVGDAIGVLVQEPTEYLAARRDRLVRARNIDVAVVEQLLRDRAAARATKDWARADAIRGELNAMKIEPLDTPTGTDWRVID